MLAGINNEEEVVASAIVGVGGGLVLQLDAIAIHVRAPVAVELLPEHSADGVLVVKIVALFGLPVGGGNAIGALEPDTSEVLVLGAWDSGVITAR